MKPIDIFAPETYRLTDLLSAQVEIDMMVRFEIGSLLMSFFECHSSFYFFKEHAKFMNLEGCGLQVEPVGEIKRSAATMIEKTRDLVVTLSSHPGAAHDFCWKLFPTLVAATKDQPLDREACENIISHLYNNSLEDPWKEQTWEMVRSERRARKHFAALHLELKDEQDLASAQKKKVI